MKYLVLDLETETHQSFKRKANPFHPENYIVMRGWKVEGDTRAHCERFESEASVKPLCIPDDVDLIVAHNAKFELLYEKRFSAEVLHEFFKRGGKIWCTQYAEYLLNGQNPDFHMVALDSIVESYGGRKKIDGVKALWEAGMLTSQIDPELLEDYLVGTADEGRNSGDIGNTELVFRGQLKTAAEFNMLRSIELRMDGLCCTAEMEWNGLKVDIERARADLAERTAEFIAAQDELQQHIGELPEGLQFKWGSNVHLSALMFGGTVRYEKQAPYLDPETGELARKWETRVEYVLEDGTTSAVLNDDQTACACCGKPAVRYLSGKRAGAHKTKQVKVRGEIKQKYQDFFHTFPGYTKPDPDWAGALKDGAGNPVYSTASDIIEQISNRNIPFLRVLGRWQALSKEIGTYYARYDEGKQEYVGMLTCVDPVTRVIHHKLNHTSTVTTRLSSSDPNMQNVPRADFDKALGRPKSTVKAMFVSRFPGGQMVEIDYSQLEVVVQGMLSGDKRLQADICANVDFHCKRVALREGCPDRRVL